MYSKVYRQVVVVFLCSSEFVVARFRGLECKKFLGNVCPARYLFINYPDFSPRFTL